MERKCADAAGDRGGGRSGGETCRSDGDCLTRQRCSECCRGESNAPAFEQQLKFFQRAGDPHSRGILVASQRGPDRAKIALFKEAEQDRGAVIRAKQVDGFIKYRSDLGEVGLGMIVQGVHRCGLLFAKLTAAFGADRVARDKAGIAMQPAAEPTFASEFAGVLRKADEDGLRDILGKQGVALDDAQRGGIDEVDVARDQFTKGCFRAVLDILRQQLLALGHLQSRV